MERPIFALLVKISRTDFFDNEDKSRITNRDKEISKAEIRRRLEYLVQQGLISQTNEKYVITEYGYHVAQFESWNEYLLHQKLLFYRKLQKEKYDLSISWFQSKTGWLPYLLSAIGIVISIYALLKTDENIIPKKNETSFNENVNNLSKDKDISSKRTFYNKFESKDTLISK